MSIPRTRPELLFPHIITTFLSVEIKVSSANSPSARERIRRIVGSSTGRPKLDISQIRVGVLGHIIQRLISLASYKKTPSYLRLDDIITQVIWAHFLYFAPSHIPSTWNRVGLFLPSNYATLVEMLFARWVDEAGCRVVVAGIAIARAAFVGRGIHAERSSTIQAGTGAIERIHGNAGDPGGAERDASSHIS